jgi:hypothetical protein
MAAKNASPVPPERRAASGSTRLIVKQGAALHQDLRTVRGLVAHPHGYSDTPLPKKLGIKAGTRLAFVRAPDGFDRTVGELPEGVEIKRSARGPLDVIVFFTTSAAELRRRFDRLAAALDPAGALWVAWPKKSSGVATDLTENTVRDVALPKGLVDNKVCAIDDIWSGLRLVIRRANRG